ncbi:MAG: endonuclease/exonuclease/phosphatase family protein [Bacteroidales bacterium]|nr:endonuclease/exonuclease/phosphatase family protein [Bacteroidales bacterium]
MASYKKIRKIEDGSAKVRVVERLLKLREQLHDRIPEKTATQTLLLATWNIREFGEGRLPESSYYIAEIIDHFDIVVIQEVNSKELGGLESVLDILGDNWSYFMSDGVEGSAGGNEAMAFVYNTNKVKFTGLAGEIVLSGDKTMGDIQFARTPFMVSFRAGWFDFKLCTVHIYYGKDLVEGVYQRRLKEIKAVSDFLLKRQESDDVSYILLGDFNIPDTEGVYFNALVENRYITKAGKDKTKEKFFIPKEIRKHPTDLGRVSHYDQIAFSLKLERNMVLYDDDEQRAGAFNYTESVYKPVDWEIYQPFYQEAYDKMIEKEKVRFAKALDEYAGKKQKYDADMEKYTAARAEYERLNAEYKKTKLGTKPTAPKKPKEPPVPNTTRTTKEEYFTGTWRTHQMSDHLPLWVELKIDFSDQYLKKQKTAE